LITDAIADGFPDLASSNNVDVMAITVKGQKRILSG
jgi:hypothetical protein